MINKAMKRGFCMVFKSIYIYNYYRTALSVEDVVRRNGVVPATIGIINGRIHIG